MASMRNVRCDEMYNIAPTFMASHSAYSPLNQGDDAYGQQKTSLRRGGHLTDFV